MYTLYDIPELLTEVVRRHHNPIFVFNRENACTCDYRLSGRYLDGQQRSETTDDYSLCMFYSISEDVFRPVIRSLCYRVGAIGVESVVALMSKCEL